MPSKPHHLYRIFVVLMSLQSWRYYVYTCQRIYVSLWEEMVQGKCRSTKDLRNLQGCENKPRAPYGTCISVPLSAVPFFNTQKSCSEMAAPRPNRDVEAQTVAQPIINHPPSSNPANPQLLPANSAPQITTNTDKYHDGNATADDPEVQRDENQGDSSDGLWSMYLTEAEKQDTEVIESWKGDTNGILVFTGLFSATVAAFLVESYKKLSPDSGDTTNALLAQISAQLVSISNGTPLASVVLPNAQTFKPTASAVRVNVLWFLSLILSLNCALSATLMQQWARRYQELAHRRGAFHRRGRMRAYIFEGINKFAMARAVATMPTLLHISVFLFFAGLIDFLLPIYTTVAYSTLGSIAAFTFAYAILTVLPNIYLNCPYRTPLSGLTWRLSQFSMMGFLWTVLLFRKTLSKLWSLANQHAHEPHGPKKWRETLTRELNTRRQWFSQGMRKSVELGAYRADSRVVTSALVWTLTALDEDKEIEAFAARIPGFFDSRVVPDATLAVLPLMSHQPNTDPIFGSRLYDLLKTCIPETSILDEKMRKNRLRICLNCLWYFGRAYNQPGVFRALPSYFPNFLVPEINRRIQAEEDADVRVIGRCFVALIVNNLAADIDSRTDPISNGELACLSAIPGTNGHDVKLLLSQPGAVALMNMTSLTFEGIGGLTTGIVPPGVLDVVQRTLGILSQARSSQENAEVRLDQPIAIINGSDGTFERILVSRLLGLLNTCIQATSPLTEDARKSCERACLKGLWYFGRAFNQLGNSVPLPPYIYIAFANPEISNSTGWSNDLVAHDLGRCVGALVVNKLAADINSRNVPLNKDELACLSAILGTKSPDVTLLLRHPGAVEFTNMVFLALDDFYFVTIGTVPSYLLDVIQQTSSALSQALPPELNAKMRLNQTTTNVSDETSLLAAGMYRSVLHAWMKNLWYFTREYNEPGNLDPLPTFIWITFTNPEMTRRIREQRDLAVRVVGRCVEALVVNKLAADISRNPLVRNDERAACLSTILGTKGLDVTLLLSHPGAIEFTNMVFLTLDDFYSSTIRTVLSDVLDVVQLTFGTLSQALPRELNAWVRLSQTDALANASDGTLTAGMYRSILRLWMKDLWQTTREYNEPQAGNRVPLPPYVCATFANPEMTHRIRKHADHAVRVIGHCVEALVVIKLAADVNSRNALVSNNELACLSTILGTKSHDVMLLLSHPGAIEFTALVFLALANIDSSASARVPSEDVLQQTFDILSRALPAELNATVRLDQTDLLMNDSLGTPSTVPVICERALCMCLKSVWNAVRASNERGNSVPLPPYVYGAFTNPEMTRRIHQATDLTTSAIGRCVEALVVNKLAADIISRNVPVSDDELKCLSAILGTEGHDPLASRSNAARHAFSTPTDARHTLSGSSRSRKRRTTIARSEGCPNQRQVRTHHCIPPSWPPQDVHTRRLVSHRRSTHKLSADVSEEPLALWQTVPSNF
ncbi:hypothetical protein H4582DRAFT_106978 [Lactarius indigo]|nr:hypothetical protein H4582DRAFT_106978 [Lactarius indigo]